MELQNFEEFRTTNYDIKAIITFSPGENKELNSIVEAGQMGNPLIKGTSTVECGSQMYLLKLIFCLFMEIECLLF